MTINPKEAPNGYKARIANDKRHPCDPCAFADSSTCLDAKCLPWSRKDNCDVYFVKLAKPTRKPVVAWVFAVEYSSPAGRYQKACRTRRAARAQVKSWSEVHGAQVRGPVKVVLR
jgi:hypothetical protein